MKTARHLLAVTVVALTLASPAGAEDKTVPESDFTAYKELAQVKLDAAKESLQKDVAALGTRVDNQDKRIDQQGNRIGDVSISLTWFGILLTLLAIIAGFVGYYTASTKARKEAQDEARKAVDDWLTTHEADLKQRIKTAEDFAAESRTHIQTFEDEINQLKTQLSDKLIAHTNQEMAKTTALAEEAKQRLQAQIAQSSSQTTPPASPEALQALQAQAESLRHKAEAEYTFSDWNDRALAAFGEGKFDDAAQYLQRVSEAPDTPPGIVARALNNRGVALERRGRINEAIAAYDLVEARYANDTAPSLREQVARALFNKGVALGQLGCTDAAIAAYDLVDTRCANDTAPALREQVARALVNKGVALRQLGRTDEAIAAYDRVEASYASASDTALREQVAMALVNKGNALGQPGRTDEAIVAYDLVDARYASDTAPALREQVARALFNKGVTLGQLGRADGAIAAYDLVKARYINDTAPAVRERVAQALVNKGVAVRQLGRTDEAIDAYDLVDTSYANDTAPALREQVARALVNKGNALGQLGRTDEAIAACDLVDARYASDTAPALREQVARALFIKGVALGQLGRTDDEIAAYDLVDARYASDTAPAVREQVAIALNNKGFALEQLGRIDEKIAAYDLIEARYANDSALRKQVAYARNGKGFTLLCRAKAEWANLDQRQANLDLAARLFEQAEADVDDKPIVLGNRAYCAHLRGEPVEVVRPLLERALTDGGERLYKATLDDLAIHPVPEDAAFRALLDEVWAEVRGEDPPEAAPVAA